MERVFQIRAVPLADLRPNPRNARTHDVPRITASIARFGFRSVVVINLDGEILAGHGRTAALRALRASGAPAPAGCEGWAVPCLVAPPETPHDALAFLIADNRAQEPTRWDPDALAEALVELAEVDALDGVGYALADVERLAASVDDARAAIEAETPDETEAEAETPEPRGLAIAITFGDQSRYARVLEMLARAPGTTYADKIESALNVVLSAGA